MPRPRPLPQHLSCCPPSHSETSHGVVSGVGLKGVLRGFCPRVPPRAPPPRCSPLVSPVSSSCPLLYVSPPPCLPHVKTLGLRFFCFPSFLFSYESGGPNGVFHVPPMSPPSPPLSAATPKICHPQTFFHIPHRNLNQIPVMRTILQILYPFSGNTPIRLRFGTT